MTEVIGVTFRHQRKVYYFDPKGMNFKKGEKAIVETAQGPEYAHVILPNTEMDEQHLKGELKRVIRPADENDDDQLALNERNEASAIKICKEKVRARGLEMKLIRAEYAFDRSKLTFFFTADGRVDFRELVKDLASVFRTRIELRQVGVRDETKLLGALGVCGREVCCSTWLPDFASVTIRMAKDQNLSLNSAKISGVCGRLMCCLKNEAEAYEYLNASLPDVNQEVTTSDKIVGKVKSVNILKQTVSVLIDGEKDEKEVREYPVSELRFRRSIKKEKLLSGITDEAPDADGERPQEHKNYEKRSSDRKNSEGRGSDRRGSDRRDSDGKGADRRAAFEKNRDVKNTDDRELKTKAAEEHAEPAAPAENTAPAAETHTETGSEEA